MNAIKMPQHSCANHRKGHLYPCNHCTCNHCYISCYHCTSHHCCKFSCYH